jgi:hypothetical protein
MMKALQDWLGFPEVTFYQVIAYLALAAFNAPWFWFVAIAILGGFASLAAMTEDPDNTFTFYGNARKVVNRLVISVFIGLMIWLGAEEAGYATHPGSRFLAGIASFYGIKSINYAGAAVKEFLDRWLDSKRG